MRTLKLAVRRQKGSVIIFAALGISLLVILLSIADIGFMYYYKREYQKAADLAALAGAKSLIGNNGVPSCANSTADAGNAVQTNLVGKQYDLPVQVKCGLWRPTKALMADRVDNSAPIAQWNAVIVTVRGDPIRFFLTPPKISASAIATTSEPVATFSVGTRLARVSGDSTLGALLKGVGLDLNGTTVASYEGLAGVKITPKGLLDALGIPVGADISVGDLNSLLAVNQVTVGALLDATVKAAGQTQLLATNAVLLGQVITKLGISALPNIQLGQAGSTRGLFTQITTATGDAALNAGVDALGLISTAIGIASAGHAVNVGVPNLLGVTAKVGVIEPPSIGIGGVGTTAYSAQVRVYVGLDTASIPGVGALLTALSPLANVRLNLPLTLDVVASKGTVQQLCTVEMRSQNYSEPGNPSGDNCPTGQDCADIKVDTDLLNLCIGSYPGGADPFSVKGSCKDAVQSVDVLRVGLLGATLLSKTGTLKTGLSTTPPEDIFLAKATSGTTGSALNLGSAASNLVYALTNFLFGGGTTPSISDADANAAAAKIWTDVGGSSCAAGSDGKTCRQEKYQAALDKVKQLNDSAKTNYNNLSSADKAALNGLTGAIGVALQNVVNGLSSLLTGVGNLVGGLLTGVADLLANILGCLFGNCPSDPCLGGLTTSGDNAACISKLANDAVKGSSSSNSTTALLNSLLGPIFNLLNSLGSGLVNTILKDLLGLHLGETDVGLTDLKCGGDPVLVE